MFVILFNVHNWISGYTYDALGRSEMLGDYYEGAGSWLSL